MKDSFIGKKDVDDFLNSLDNKDESSMFKYGPGDNFRKTTSKNGAGSNSDLPDIFNKRTPYRYNF